MYEPETLVLVALLPVSWLVLLLLLPCCSNIHKHEIASKTVHAMREMPNAELTFPALDSGSGCSLLATEQ